MTLFEIYELLMEYTHQYTRMMNTGVRGKEFKECEEMILRLQEEISERRKISERRS
jgi:deoxyhypusine synthase